MLPVPRDGSGLAFPTGRLFVSVKMSGSKRSGQVLIMTTLLIVPLVGALGLVTDFGYMHYVKETAQSAAESAAQAAVINFHQTQGGAAYTCSLPAGSGPVVCANPSVGTCDTSIAMPQNAVEHGCMYAQAHGFNSAGSVTYQSDVNSVPPDAPGMPIAGWWVTYRAIKRVPQLFSAILGNTSGLVVARSTGAVVGATDCIYALDPTQQAAISVGGSANLVASCGLYVNSNATCALSTNGNATVSATEYDVVGTSCTHNVLSPTPNTGVAPTTDPLSGLPAPASPTYNCDYKNYNMPNNKAVTLSAGVYCGGINVGNNTVTFQPGNYILVGGGLTTQSTNSIIAGAGVMFYNTYGNGQYNGGTTNYSYSPININANSSVTLTAPTTGTYAGILFFDDRTAPSGNPDSYGGGASAVYTGTIYDANNGITMYGNSSINTAYTLIVADTISLIGTSTFNDNYSSLPQGSPIQQVAIVE